MNANQQTETHDQQHCRGLRVVGVGWGRTGTKTICQVLSNDFGLKCHHMEETMKNRTGDLFCELGCMDPNDTKSKHKLFDQIFHSNSNSNSNSNSADINKQPYLATVDWPTTKFWRDLVDHYPNSKVLLTIRDPEKWYESANDSICKLFDIIENSLIMRLGIVKYLFPWFWTQQRMGVYCVFDKLPNEKNKNEIDITDSWCGKFDDKEYIINKFNKHIEQVKKYVSKDRLIIFDITKHGYDELINGLKDVAVKIPYEKQGQKLPKLNSKQEWNEKIRIGNIVRIVTDIVVVGAICALVFFTYKLFLVSDK